MVIRESLVLRRTVWGDSDWRVDNLSEIRVKVASLADAFSDCHERKIA